jgi:hypothetical protein
MCKPLQIKVDEIIPEVHSVAKQSIINVASSQFVKEY